jgi:hypothetical protein
MYADDTVLFSENVHELQNMINVVKCMFKWIQSACKFVENIGCHF